MNNCYEFPIYGAPERQPKRCYSHRLGSDVESKGNICVYPGCCIEKFINKNYCLIHSDKQGSIPGLSFNNIDIKCCTYKDCTLNASYGFYNTDKVLCVFHSALDRNIYAVQTNVVECVQCSGTATQYSDIDILKSNPYAVPNLCSKCAEANGIKQHHYDNCSICGCYTILYTGITCASCYVAGFNNHWITSSWDKLLKPISKKFITKRSSTGEFICTIKSRVCKNGDRNVFKAPKLNDKYSQFVLSVDARTPVRNRYIRGKKLSSNHDTLLIMNEECVASNSDALSTEEKFLGRFINTTFKSFKYFTLDNPSQQSNQSLKFHEFVKLPIEKKSAIVVSILDGMVSGVN
jgi:hypothetical protein